MYGCVSKDGVDEPMSETELRLIQQIRAEDVVVGDRQGAEMVRHLRRKSGGDLGAAG